MRKLLLGLPLLAGCVSTTPITLPGGSAGFSIECHHQSACYNAAAQACAPKTYEILDKDGYSTSAVVANQGHLYGASRRKTDFTVRCISP